MRQIRRGKPTRAQAAGGTLCPITVKSWGVVFRG